MKRSVAAFVAATIAVGLSLENPTYAGERHWAYVAPVRPGLPPVADPAWPRNPVDHFILARLEETGLEPAPEADRARLVRRLSLDLIGLPPHPDRVDAFLADSRPDAWERLVDELLASPHYGEHWARSWLDLARYADSNGFQRDGHRSAWPYRDWVVDALNRDLPYDRFSIEQLAGDLLPDATLEQRIATGFHRSTTVNVEAGTDSEENRVKAVIDRVNTTATVWLGTTLECAQCHDHKYDPFSQQDYYRLFAYFNSTALETEEAKKGASRQFIGPWVELPQSRREQARLAEAEERLKSVEAERDQVRARELARLGDWETEVREDAEKLAAVSSNVREALLTPPDKRNDEQRALLEKRFFVENTVYQAARKRVDEHRHEVDRKRPATALVMKELEAKRKTHVFERGNFLRPLARVEPGTPSALHSPAEGAAPNRLGLAEWVTSPRNPLTARVAVNRAWDELFGRGLVASNEDFGKRGAEPSHPELLDWLATEFLSSGWSLKQLHRLLVTSATYRQSARVTALHLERDPDNELHARGPRFRLSAEAVRDSALAASGLLAADLGGAPVYPRQPDDVWTVIGVVDNTYRTSAGRDQYRRSLYTVWRRSSPYPSLVNFDAPSRGSICVKRPRTNTPLQALTLLNDPVYVEIAHALADRVLSEIPQEMQETTVTQIRHAFRLCLSRHPHGDEIAALREIYDEQSARLHAHPQIARELLAEHPRKAMVGALSDAEASRRGAWFYVASVLLNLDEFINK